MPGVRLSRKSTFHCARVTPSVAARRSKARRSACAVSAISNGRFSIRLHIISLLTISTLLCRAGFPTLLSLALEAGDQVLENRLVNRAIELDPDVMTAHPTDG